MTHPYVTLDNWIRSVGMLGIDITLLHENHNTMPESSAEKGFYFFSDHGIPMPRAATIIAWASALSMNPIHGHVTIDNKYQSYRMDRGWFLLPFLPPLIHEDPQALSLSRQSRLHILDVDNKIVWGSAYICHFETVSVMGLTRTDINMLESQADRMQPSDFVYPVPPLWASIGDGFQFGFIQHNHNLLVRTPFEMLASQGIPIINLYARQYWPMNPIRRLMFRMTKPEVAQEFATAYVRAVHEYLNHGPKESEDAMREQLRTLEAQRLKQAEPKKDKKYSENQKELMEYFSSNPIDLSFK